MNHTECQQYTDSVSNRLRKLTEANRSLAEIESLDDLLPRLMDLSKEVTAAEASLIFLYNSATNFLEVVSISDDRFGGRANELYKGTATLKPNRRGAHKIWNYVVDKFYNFVTSLIIY